ncbi:hypothetical protein PVAND_001691 [Polypedilum vanderplanki]|uniref:Uncharacterized protein n=1 Tax=Polypedilum vanderplanki TaxID=319348 RepID=A0A9J6BNN9_POLVA|nr:hypothetical protein PVAND_001691 [Polypedilum vanderplanki]
MVRFNRRTHSERQEERHTPTLPVPQVPSPLRADLANYRIPRRQISPEQEIQVSQPQPEAREQQSPSRENRHSRKRERSRHNRRRRNSPSPRHHRGRDHSLERHRRRIRRSRSPRREVRFQHVHEEMEISPVREPPRPAHPPQRRNSIHRRPPAPGNNLQLALAARLGPIPASSPLVRVVQRRTISVLKFERVPTNIGLLNFLTLLGREMRSVVGATRLYDYEQKIIGDSIFVYLVDQQEIDAAVGRGFTFNFSTGQQLITPLLLSAAITSINFADAQDPTLSLIPTLMLRNLIPVTTRQAIASAIDAVDIVSQRVNYVTHVRLPAKGLDLAKTSSLAFVGIDNLEQVNQLDGQEIQRVGRSVPLHKSKQVPVLVPTGFMRQERDSAWAQRAAQGNMLIAKPNPFG